jgi:hypothetical protein
MTTIRDMADEYYALTGESAYMGSSQGSHYFVDGNVRGDDAAREHMQRLLDNVHRLTPDGHRWIQPSGSDRALLIDDNGKTVRTVHATEHPWREA